ncbi:hypothetical protein ACFVYE_29080 [Streptomyces sp. NPDC058239]|uniref:hypothetical protein n=1 Tax=unclassified Streptomyces TaxID=2593676 RepID=UPI003664FA1C
MPRVWELVTGGPPRAGPQRGHAAIESRPDREQEMIAFRLKELRAGMETTLQGIKTLAEEGGRSGWKAVVRRRFASAGHGLICR